MVKANNWMKPAILVHVGRSSTVREVMSIAEEADYKILKVFYQNKPRSSKFYIGRGKVEEIRDYISTLNGLDRNALKVIVNGVLKPNQAYNLMRELEVEVIDRLLLILEVFSKHAGSREAKLQIELAKLSHQLPLLKEWVRLSKIGELPGFLSSGGYKVEAYYEMVRRRITKIREELDWVRDRRKILRMKRRKMGIPLVAIAGYFSAGKTTLFNKLVGENKPTGEEPFTTLSPKSKRMSKKVKAILVDTVGFIEDLPVELVKAFNATLEEISDADLIMLVVDISEDLPEVRRKTIASLEVLENIGALQTPIVVVANKVDISGDMSTLKDKIVEILKVFKTKIGREVKVIPVSAKTGYNVNVLIEELYNILAPRIVEVTVRVPKGGIDSLNLPLTSPESVDGVFLEFKISVPLGDLEYLREQVLKVGGRVLY